MTSVIRLFATIFLMYIICSVDLWAQIMIDNEEGIENVFNGVTYVAMHDPDAESAEPFKEVFRKYWDISDIRFIRYDNLSKYINPGSSFITIGGYITNVQFIKQYDSGIKREGIDFENTHIYLELWKPDKETAMGFNKNSGMDKDDKIQLARVELYTDFETLSNPENIFDTNYDGDGHIRNWGPGILKNYLQELTRLLKEGKDRSLFAENEDSRALLSLKRKILYVPDYLLVKFDAFSGDESERHQLEKLFKKYDYKYELISIKDLNQKILSDSSEFYYLTYIKSSTDKFICVTNSHTGKIIYSDYSPLSYNIKKKDLKKISKSID